MIIIAIYSYCNKCGKKIPYKARLCDECKTEYYSDCRKNRNQDEVRFYGSGAWRRLREQVLEDNNYMCYICKREGKISVATDVHHIEKVLEAWDKRYDYDNLVCLCHDCHVDVHSGRVEV